MKKLNIDWMLVGIGLVALGVALSIFGAAFSLGAASQAQVTQAQADLAAEYKTSAALNAGKAAALKAQVSLLTAQAAVLQGTVAELSIQVEDLEGTVAQLRQMKRATSSSPSVITAACDGWTTTRASWYGPGLYGNTTANGNQFTPELWCVAHPSLPMGTVLEVEYNGQVVQVPVLDRGPFVAGRGLDLSNAVAQALGFSGVQTVKYRVVGR